MCHLELLATANRGASTLNIKQSAWRGSIAITLEVAEAFAAPVAKPFACDCGSLSQLRRSKSNEETQESGFKFQRCVQIILECDDWK